MSARTLQIRTWNARRTKRNGSDSRWRCNRCHAKEVSH